MILEEYRGRKISPKTKSKREIRTGNSRKMIYVIQKHDASHLHYDLRLELDGVLKSWAIPKEPPTRENVKRLAVQVEDHPVSYASFEGVIPEGMYGAGKVEIWDKGTYEPEEIGNEKIVVNIKGRKLMGKYVLIKTRMRDKDTWLFFKKTE